MNTRVSVTHTAEAYSHVSLSDGTTLKIKPIVIGVERIEGTYTDSGDPAYRIHTQMVCIVDDAPDALRRKEAAPIAVVQ